MKKFGYLALGLSLTVLLGATVYNQFSPGGALSGTWNSQNVNVGAGSSFITGQLPPANGGTGLATLTAHGIVLGEGTSNVGAVAAMAADTLLQGQGTGADPSAVALLNCGDATHALSYSTSTHTFSCQAISSLSTPVTVANGGTGLGTLTAHGILLGEATSNVGAVAAMAADTLLQGQGTGADPAAVTVNNCGSSSTALSYSTTTHAFGCQTITGGSATPAGVSGNVQYNSAGSFGGVSNGTSGQALLSNGASAPSWGAPAIITTTQSSANSNFPFLGANGTQLVWGAGVTFNPNTNTLNATTFSGNATTATLAATLTSTSTTTNANYPPLLGNGTTIQYDASVLINPSTHTVTATTFSGALSGNATSATSATNLSGGAVTTNSSGALLSGGTKFTASGCSNSATVGGAIAGKFTSGTSGTCTVTITLPTAANGWACRANDITTPAVMNQTATATTSCTISGTTTTSDIVVFMAMGY